MYKTNYGLPKGFRSLRTGLRPLGVHEPGTKRLRDFCGFLEPPLAPKAQSPLVPPMPLPWT